MPSPFIQILNSFAEARNRPEREVHRGDEMPVGEGWVRIEYDPVIQYAVWERREVGQ